MDDRNFRKLSQVLQPHYQKPCQPGAQWYSAEIHCPDPQLSISHYGLKVPIGWLKQEPEALSTGELVSLLTTCLALIDPRSYIDNPTRAMKTVQWDAVKAHNNVMPQLQKKLEQLSIKQQAQA
eukprot:2526328-Amphidinium_carterae.1